MSFKRVQELLENAQNLEDFASKPPFFGKDNWTIDPAKIVIKPLENSLPTTPEEEPVKTTTKTATKRVRFASYVEVYLRCPADKNGIQYPSKSFAKLKQNNTIMLKEKRIEELEDSLKQARKELIRAHDYRFLIIMATLVFIGLVMSYNYINNGL